MASQPNPNLTPEQYLTAERKATQKSEYLNGEIFAMTGATKYHVRIATSLVAGLVNQVRGTSFNIYSSDLRVAVSPKGFYTYPDIVVTCGEERFLDTELDTLLNPLFIIEVSSESTQDYDRGRKFQSYRSLSSLREYWTVAQNAINIEQWSYENGWRLQEHHAGTLASAGEAAIRSTALPQLEIPLSVIYENVAEQFR